MNEAQEQFIAATSGECRGGCDDRFAKGDIVIRLSEGRFAHIECHVSSLQSVQMNE